MKDKKPKTYAAEFKGGKVRVTVPQNNDEDILIDALRDNFNPEAIVAIAAHLRAGSTNSPDVNRQIHWFIDQLVKMVGDEQYNQLLEEITR